MDLEFQKLCRNKPPQEFSDGERKKSHTPSTKKRRVARCSEKEGNKDILEFLKEIEIQCKKEHDRLLERLIEKL